MKIVPAILAQTLEEFLLRLRQAESFTDYVQIDIMDGVFVPSQSFPADEISRVNTSLYFEIHLMVKHPSAFATRIDNPHLKKVIFHFESGVNHINFVTQLQKRGIEAGLAVNPGTGIDQIKKIAESVDTLLFLTVDPGAYGSPFRSEVLHKIREARDMFKDKIIAADGGVSIENLKSFSDIGVDYVCVGSRIFLDTDPAESYRRFTDRLAELKAGSPGT